MNTTTMPGFTADASLYKMDDFRTATVISCQDTGENVQPAMIATCAVYWSLFMSTRDPVLRAVLAGLIREAC
jgi:hypothetical protein